MTCDILDSIVWRVTSLLSLWHATSLAIFCDMWHIWLFLVTSLWFWSFFCDTRSKCVQILRASEVLFDTHLRRSNQQLFTKMRVNNCLSIYYTEIKWNSWRTILSHWLPGGEQFVLITFERANQRARKTLFACAVCTDGVYLLWRFSQQPLKFLKSVRNFL